MYKKDPGFSDKASSAFSLELGAPMDLPDALRGEKWSFVQLPLGVLQEVGGPWLAGWLHEERVLGGWVGGLQ